MTFIENSFVSPRGYALTGVLVTLFGFTAAAESRSEQLVDGGLALIGVGAVCLLGAAIMKSHLPPPSSTERD